MELKHKWMTGIGIALGLLIVPYGIETSSSRDNNT